MTRTILYNATWTALLILTLPAQLSADGHCDHGHAASEACLCDDDVWIVSTRGLRCSCEALKPSDLSFERLEGDHWHPSSVDEFVSSQPEHSSTVVYVHGNRVNPESAASRGLSLYRHSLHRCDTPQRIRFVIWSWPSDRVSGLIRDVRLKALRTNLECSYLSWFLRRIPGHSATSLIGYSFGARIVIGALQSLSERRDGHRLPPLRVVLLAAAIDRDWLTPNGRYGQALQQACRVMLLYNPIDPALKRYRVVDPRNGPTALGYIGLRNRGARYPHVEQLNVANVVGRSHFEFRYYNSPPICTRLRPFLLWQDSVAVERMEHLPSE